MSPCRKVLRLRLRFANGLTVVVPYFAVMDVSVLVLFYGTLIGLSVTIYIDLRRQGKVPTPVEIYQLMTSPRHKKKLIYGVAALGVLIFTVFTDFSDPTGKSYSYGANNYTVSFLEDGKARCSQKKQGQKTPYCRTTGSWYRSDEFIILEGFSNVNCDWVARDLNGKFITDGNRLVKR